ncbi:T9SS type A sorting domain-containing protein [Flavobacterium sp. IMCC34852]|uniref:T9SS type A sorting domain-containing protein n=1 Tax=Flavobacterium rivulicola TaxID=2732161 RepID=A0A7Y3VYD6_9FLAO|nr:T9SS type A sorting domain-containing protein [Flavobacterium sp. IMCC34852]NNT71584.1 T9SS type A sorting domain-containing protein [Flavobacterium sp. IMCC34852]
MKNQFLKKYLLNAILVLCFSTIYSQENKQILDCRLWIKSLDIPQKFSSEGSLNKENELVHYFNFNPIVDFSKNNIQKRFKNIVKKESTLFTVIKSPASEDNAVLTIEKDGNKTLFTTKKIVSDKDLLLNKDNSEKGMLITYACNKNSTLTKKKGSIAIDDLFYEDEEGKNMMMELIYFPRYLNQLEQNMIESYLSIKYGISLKGDKDYYNSSKERIWCFKDNKDYSYRVSGIGRDDLFELNQKQTGNFEKDGLYIGFNKIEKSNELNKEKIEDKTFIIWGDNNQTTLIKENEGHYKKMNRVWKLESRGKLNTVFTTQIILNKEEMVIDDLKNEGYSTNDIVWLAIDTTQSGTFNFKSAHYIKSEIKENNLVFNKVLLKSNTSFLMTFVKASDFIVKEEIEAANCSLGQYGKAKITIVGGNAPFKLKLFSDHFSKDYYLNDDFLEVDHLKDGNYQLEITDATSKVQKSSFTVDGFVDSPVSLFKEWVLNDEGNVIIKPETQNITSIKGFEWFNNTKLVSSDKEMLATIPGEYSLVLTNENGCIKTFDFTVRENLKGVIDNWKIYPNPTKTNENFTISFTFEKSENVTVTLLDVNGRNIKKTDLGAIQQFEYRDNLSVSGTYFVIITKEGVSYTSKLIIQ